MATRKLAARGTNPSRRRNLGQDSARLVGVRVGKLNARNALEALDRGLMALDEDETREDRVREYALVASIEQSSDGARFYDEPRMIGGKYTWEAFEDGVRAGIDSVLDRAPRRARPNPRRRRAEPLPAGRAYHIMPVMQISGTKQLGADLHQWHAGMDAIYAVGSQFYAGRPVDMSDAQDALRLLEQEHRNRKATKLSRSAVAQLNAVIRNLRHRIDAASARPNPCSCSMRRANPSKPKARTYAVARAEILRALQQDGWDVRANLKMPHATYPRGGFRLWFKTQAIYESHGSETSSFAGAHSLWIGDIRTMPIEDVLAHIERVRKSS